MRRTRASARVLIFVLACLPLVLSAPVARAVTVSVSPADTIVTVGDVFSLRVQCDAFPDLKAYQLIFGFGPVVLQYLGPTAGDVLTGSGRPYTVQSVPDAAVPADTAWVDCAQLVGNAASPGVLIYLNFKALAIGDSPIDCLQVDFRDSLNNQSLPACVGGVVHVRGPTPARRASWGSVKTIYR